MSFGALLSGAIVRHYQMMKRRHIWRERFSGPGNHRRLLIDPKQKTDGNLPITGNGSRAVKFHQLPVDRSSDSGSEDFWLQHSLFWHSPSDPSNCFSLVHAHWGRKDYFIRHMLLMWPAWQPACMHLHKRNDLALLATLELQAITVYLASWCSLFLVNFLFLCRLSYENFISTQLLEVFYFISSRFTWLPHSIACIKESNHANMPALLVFPAVMLLSIWLSKWIKHAYCPLTYCLVALGAAAFTLLLVWHIVLPAHTMVSCLPFIVPILIAAQQRRRAQC